MGARKFGDMSQAEACGARATPWARASRDPVAERAPIFHTSIRLPKSSGCRCGHYALGRRKTVVNKWGKRQPARGEAAASRQERQCADPNLLTAPLTILSTR